MAEILLRRRDNHRPLQSTQMAYRPGDVVTIQPDGHEWGEREGPPNFDLVKLPLIPVAALLEYAKNEEQYSQIPGTGEPEWVPIRRRPYRVDVNLLPLQRRLDLELTGQTVINDREALQSLVDKRTSQTEWQRGRRGL